MSKPKLIPVSYNDNKNAIRLNCYADTLVYEMTGENSGKLLGIRFGGYPEQARGMSDAIFGGGQIDVTRENAPPLTLMSLTKQYTRQLTMDGVYAEAVLFANDDSDVPVRNADKKGEQTEMETPPHCCYFFTPPGDKDRLFEEIDKRVRVPLIPQFRDYLLERLTKSGTLSQLTVLSLHEQFDAWRLSCTADDGNIIKVVEDGLKSGAIEIPGATPDSSAVFDGINTVSQYLQAFGVTIADRIKSQFVPLFDPARCASFLAPDQK